MSILSLLAFLVVVGPAATATTTNTGKKQVPFEIVEFTVPPRDGRQLRGAPLGLDMPFPKGALSMGAFPMRDIPFEVPGNTQGAPVVDGALLDLLNFGSALGSATLLRPGGIVPDRMPVPRRFGGVSGAFGGPLELPLDSLHVKMQQDAPAPLKFEDAHGKLHIFGTLPKKLSAKTLKVSFSGAGGRDLIVQYPLGKSHEASNAVAIEERFALDFRPVRAPSVKYKAATGAFELVLARPEASSRKPVTIDFDTAAAKAAAKPIQAQTRPVQVVALKPRKATAGKVALKRAKFKRVQRRTARAKASVKEFVHNSKRARVPASGVMSKNARNDDRIVPEQEMHALAKVTKELRKVPPRKGKAARFQDVKNTAKQFVADAHLREAQSQLVDAFAPLDDFGLVMLEISHQVSSVPKTAQPQPCVHGGGHPSTVPVKR